MKNKLLKTVNNNHYLFSENKRMILYIPSYNTLNTLKPCYNDRKREFLVEHGFFKPYIPDLTTFHDIQRIKSNLANLRMLLIEMTDECNLACKYCGYREFYDNYDIRENKKQNFLNVKALIDYLADLWRSPFNVSYNNTITIGFYGGEPLLSFAMIKEIIQYLDSLEMRNINFSFNMTTNGMLLDRYMDYLVEKNFNILISLDGSETNNAYRVTKNGKPSFSKIVSNTFLLKEKYPQYFNEHVQFNAVLHNNNSVEEIYRFIKNQFNKIPKISELNANGVKNSKKDEFYKMFKNRTQNRESSSLCEDINEDLFFTNPNVSNLSFFMDAFLSNTYNSYADLFIDESVQKYIPTGTCQPFNRKIFLTVNGKILPCERIGQESPLGKIENGKVNIDFEFIQGLYSVMFEKVINYCKKCALWKNCTYCVYFIKGSNGCSRFIERDDSSDYFSHYLSYIENKPTTYSRIINEMNQY